ncbi:MAG: M23 family metallopeptidase, partial [Oscillospiraceae bacterium]|nr:M23 family metallopeptidase [Oscillospiraceae bacterium]
PQPEKTAPVMNPVEVPIEEETKPAEPEKPTEKTEEKTEKPAEAVQEGALEKKSENASSELSFTIPVAGPVTVPYSYDGLIYSKTMHDWRTHDGIDIEAPIGTKVKAVAQGSVLSVEQDDLLGTVVTIDHGDGIVSVYANLAAVPTVKAGDAVTMGSVIGSVGDTALGETGEVQHLHFAMMKDGTPVDPYKYIPQR